MLFPLLPFSQLFYFTAFYYTALRLQVLQLHSYFHLFLKEIQYFTTGSGQSAGILDIQESHPTVPFSNLLENGEKLGVTILRVVLPL